MNEQAPTPDTPLLTLCIPTWNRANRLSLLLENIKREIQGLEDWIQVVVADNASSDDTSAVVATSPLTITYGRQESTVGITNNIFFATCTLARGRFIWIIGDDDLIAPGGLARILASLQRAADIDYHYVNFCAIDADYRDKVIQLMGGIPPASAMQIRQCDEPGWKLLERAEQLAFLPGYNPSSLFSSLFCYVASRAFYLEARTRLTPSNSLDGSSRSLDDMFPQALITLPHIIGRPIAYIGDPCVLQGAHAWEWNRYLSQISILGIHKLMNWMAGIGFDAAALEQMRNSHARTIATKLPPMLLAPDGNLGLNDELRKLIADYTQVTDFWQIFTLRMKARMETEFIARQLVIVLDKLQECSGKIGILGERALKEKVLELSPNIRTSLSWTGFNDGSWTGQRQENGKSSTSHGHHLRDQDIDVLILAVHPEHTPPLHTTCSQYMKPGSYIIDAQSVTPIN
jgi:hypothetical protein